MPSQSNDNVLAHINGCEGCATTAGIYGCPTHGPKHFPQHIGPSGPVYREGEGPVMDEHPWSSAEATRAAMGFTVVPTSRHGAVVEWHLGGADIEVEFDASGRAIGVSMERVSG